MKHRPTDANKSIRLFGINRNGLNSQKILVSCHINSQSHNRQYAIMFIEVTFINYGAANRTLF